MKRLASVVARVLMALIYPAYYSACTLLALRLFDILAVPWPAIFGLACFPVLTFVVDTIVDTIYPSSPINEPGGTPGTED